jgi:hypothetical protein
LRPENRPSTSFDDRFPQGEEEAKKHYGSSLEFLNKRAIKLKLAEEAIFLLEACVDWLVQIFNTSGRGDPVDIAIGYLNLTAVSPEFFRYHTNSEAV